MRTALYYPSSESTIREETVSSILSDIVAVAADPGQSSFKRSLHRPGALRALARAREYIEAHLTQAIRIEFLCRYARANHRSLERAFHSEMGMSPQQYVKVRRLIAVRTQLLAAEHEQGVKVTEVALANGFSHLGRFAGDYNQHFGEYPRSTLKDQ